MNKGKQYGRRTLRASDLKFISDVVWKVFSVTGIEKRDFSDIEHELVLVLAKRTAKFDSRVNSWKTFRAVVVQRALTDYVRKHIGQDSYFKRKASFTLDDQVPGSKRSNPLFYRDLVNSDGVLSDGTERGDAERMNTVLDVRAAIATMSPVLRKTCHAIMLLGNNKSKIAEHLGVERRTVRKRFSEIQKVLILHGFGEGEFEPQ